MNSDSGSANQAAAAYLKTLAPDKRRPVARLLQLFVGEGSTLDDFGWSSVSPSALIDARSRLGQKYSPSTVNSMLSCVRSVLRYGLRIGILPAEQYLDSRDVAGLDRRRPTASLELTPGQLRLLFRSCANDGQPLGKRDAFILLMTACAGFDRREIVTLSNLQLLRQMEDGVFVAQVHQQARRHSLLLRRRALGIVKAWLDLRGTAPGPTVCAVPDHDTLLPSKGVHEQLTYRVIQKRAQEARLGRITTTALKWYYRRHLLLETDPTESLIPGNFRRVLEPPE